jgi:hypothetical protein
MQITVKTISQEYKVTKFWYLANRTGVQGIAEWSASNE